MGGKTVPKVEITEEMIRAGAKVLEDSGYLEEPVWSGLELLVQQVFRAMVEADQRGNQ